MRNDTLAEQSFYATFGLPFKPEMKDRGGEKNLLIKA